MLLMCISNSTIHNSLPNSDIGVLGLGKWLALCEHFVLLAFRWNYCVRLILKACLKDLNHIFLLFSFSVPGVIGCLQALEAIKIASSVGEPLSRRMLLFDSFSERIRIACLSFFVPKLEKFNIRFEPDYGFCIKWLNRGRSMLCEACREDSAFTGQKFSELDYEEFTHSPMSMAHFFFC